MSRRYIVRANVVSDSKQRVTASETNVPHVYIDSVYMGEDFDGNLSSEDIEFLNSEYRITSISGISIGGIVHERGEEWGLKLVGPIDRLKMYMAEIADPMEIDCVLVNYR